MDRFVDLIMKVRGTANYEGEEKGAEVWNIIIGMIIPAVFLFTLVIIIFLNRKKNKKPINICSARIGRGGSLLSIRVNDGGDIQHGTEALLH